MKLLRLLRLVFHPFKSIAKSLEKIASLYEAELGARNPPIMLVTENPDPKNDTEILYSDVEDKRPAYRR